MSDHNGDDLVIERPELQTWPVVLGSRLVTAAMWALYAYLWLPLLTFLAWILGIRVAYQQMVEFGGYQVALALWATFAVVILVLGGGLLAWARMNFYRFRGGERRQGVGATDRNRLAADFSLSMTQLATLEHSRRIHIDHHPTGDIARVEIVPIGRLEMHSPTTQPSSSR